MAQFAKAQPKQARLKIGFYGPPGSGKTFTALLLAEGLAQADGKRIAFVDTENGTTFYAQDVAGRQVHPGAFDFDALYTTSMVDTIEAIEKLDPQTHGVIVLDSVSHLWDSSINAYSGKRTKADTIPMHAWAHIKRPYKALIRTLLDGPYHVIICGRQKNVFETIDGEMVKTGVSMRAEGETEYEPHVCIRMECKRGDPTVYANVEKDRSGVLAGKVLPNPSFSTFAPLLTLLGTEQRTSEDPDEVAARDAELLSKDGDKAKAKEARSEELLAKHSAAIASAPDLEAMNAIAGALKKDRRYLLDEHEESIRILYAQRHKVLSGNLAPAEV